MINISLRRVKVSQVVGIVINFIKNCGWKPRYFGCSQGIALEDGFH